MKVLVYWLLLSIASLVYAAEELAWTAVDIPGLEFTGDGTLNYGLWFHGDFGWLNSGRQLWITRDAGRNWALSLTPPEKFYFFDSYFLNSLEGWAVTWQNSLFHTKDGGTSWEKMEVQLTQTLDDPAFTVLSRVYFKNSLNGLGVFSIDTGSVKPPPWSGGIIARTKDGGEHWTEVGRGSSFPQLIGFGDAVWIDGVLDSGYYTPDFGDTIRPIFIPYDNQAAFASPSHAWTLTVTYVGEELEQGRRWDVSRTTDGGNGWSDPIFSRTVQEFRSGIRGLCLMSEDVGAVLWYSYAEKDGPSLLYVTYNSGNSWLSYHVPIQPDYYKVSCNRQRRELWLFPYPYSLGEGGIFFYTSIDIVAAVQPSNRLFTTWALIKAGEEH